MRRIKFRAWFKVLKRMYIARELRFSRNGSIVVITKNTGGTAPNSYELMQFTGLRDKNWKEIYEGDVINDFGGIEGADRFGSVIFSEKHGAFMFDGFCGYPYFIRENMATDCEVVGNIYENPKLLCDAVHAVGETGGEDETKN